MILCRRNEQRLQRIHRVQHQEAAQIDVILHRGPRHVQRGQRIVAQQHPQLRIIAGAALLIQRRETWSSHMPAAHARAHADFEQIDFRRKLVLGLHVAQQSPEIRHAVGDCLRIVAVGSAARQRLLVTLAGGQLPIVQAAPVKLVEIPHDAGSHGFELFQRQPVLILRLRRVAVSQGAQQTRRAGIPAPPGARPHARP